MSAGGAGSARSLHDGSKAFSIRCFFNKFNLNGFKSCSCRDINQWRSFNFIKKKIQPERRCPAASRSAGTRAGRAGSGKMQPRCRKSGITPAAPQAGRPVTTRGFAERARQNQDRQPPPLHPGHGHNPRPHPSADATPPSAASPPATATVPLPHHLRYCPPAVPGGHGVPCPRASALTPGRRAQTLLIFPCPGGPAAPRVPCTGRPAVPLFPSRGGRQHRCPPDRAAKVPALRPGTLRYCSAWG